MYILSFLIFIIQTLFYLHELIQKQFLILAVFLIRIYIIFWKLYGLLLIWLNTILFKTLSTSTSILPSLSLFDWPYIALWNWNGLINWISWCLIIHFQCLGWILWIYFVIYWLILFANIFTRELVAAIHILIHRVIFCTWFLFFISINKLRWVNLMN